ncbi:MAG: aminotransferase class V-fold PLP-dependent enzyme [Armatimonadetes bacterium]|nr:aminotransferase class V-fold PLP-dependent enzyme [Armatimonadota bacterium]NIM24239.1 aminotransferase class V-fold PLP-dependent enzyme [Armatimonadota bacterium]NIM68108.1 aminotransferase class V-fold PLP-dependent enzyme [Armatimonadota bacterium]NIM76570.1 aminotransferase class V-fold PLP-dependent enzyme [Armatimonadota bacterium]NIN06313.1 aminotransferase class V-fold PLP-dependent enzyme [Armatimonadota bacterium]
MPTLEEKQLLLIPGPTPVPQAVLRACARPMINHRGPEYARLQNENVAGMKEMFQTKNEILVLTCSGTGGMEAAIVNTLSPGDKVLALVIGAFGKRFVKIARAYGADVEEMEFTWGEAVDPRKVRDRLSQDKSKEIKAVLIQHNETSTGVYNDLKVIGPIIREHGALSIVDAVSGLIALDLQTDNWNIDVVAAASQKAFMLPPGLAFVSMNERAWQAYEKATTPRFYFDLKSAKEFAEKGQNPFTPALPQVFGLQEGLRLLRQEGLQNVFLRHQRLGDAVRAGAKALGLELFAKPANASNCVTAVKSPEGLGADDIRKFLLEKYGLVLAGGQAHLKGKIFRIGHLGYVSETDILGCMAALGAGLQELGVSVDPGAGAAAAMASFQAAER